MSVALGDSGVASARQRAHLISPTLVGRSSELEQLAATVARHPAVAVIEGEAGIGKTRLLSDLRSRPELARRRFLVGACRHIREPFPLGPVVEALRHVGGELDTAELSPVSGALRSLLPELGHVLPPRLEPLADRSAERHRTFRGLTELLDSLGPTILAIEDAHWIDEQTVDFLSHLLATPLPDLTVILTFRGEEVPPGVRTLTTTLPESVVRLHLVLGPLDVADTGAMAAALLGIGQVSDEFALYLCERTAGLPFAIQELLALLRTRGTLVPRGTSWARKALAELDVPARIRDQVLERVSRLSEDGRTVAEAAAVLQLPTPLATLVGTCPASDDQALRGVDEAVAAGLLVEQGEALGFRHLLAAQAVYEAIALPRRRGLHQRAAAALEQLWPVPLGQVAHHRREAGQTGAWLEAAERAADRAAETCDEAEAARLLEELLRHAPLDPRERTRVAAKLGRVALEAARPATLIGPLADALEQDADLPRATRGRLHFWLGLLMHQTGHDPARQRELFTTAVAELDDQPALQASAMICLALGPPPLVSEHLTWVRRAREILPRVEDPAYEVFLQSKVGGVLVLAGDPQWRPTADRIVERTRGEPRHRHEVRAFSTIASCACWAGHHELAADWLSRALAADESSEDERLALRLGANVAVLDFCRGRWDGLRDRVDRLIDRFAERPRIRIDLDAVASRLALAEGDTVVAVRRLDDLGRAIEQLDAYDLLPMAVETRIRLALAQGDVATAVVAAEELRDALTSVGIWLPVTRAVPAVVEALTAAGRGDETAAWLTGLERDLGELDAPLAPAALAYSRGLLAVHESRFGAAAEELETAATRYDAVACRYEAATARERAATARLADERPDDARELMRAAVATFQELGARWDVDRAAGLARRHGVSIPSRHRGGRRGYGTDLSPREREVAELAAAGHTNREIADKLFISVNTVKKQLSAAMRKLGVRTRAALPRRLDEDDT